MPTHMKLFVSLTNPDDIRAEAVTLEALEGEPGKYVEKIEKRLLESEITIEGLFQKRPIQLGVIYYTHNSPGCVYYIGNKKYELC
jgi:hypothetical protein